MRNTLLALAATLFLSAACKSTEPPKSENATAGSKGVGAAVSDAAPVAVAAVLANPDAYVGKPVVVEGAPAEVCPKKGCWMLFGEGARQMRVTFKDYGFFVPTDSAGRTMRFEGTLSVKTLSEAEARHFLEDQGKTEEAKKVAGEQKELSFVATGVKIRG